MGENMYFLGMSCLHPLKTQLLVADSSPFPFGGIKLAGTIRGNPGTGHQKMRILGSYALVYLVNGQGEFGDATGNHQKVGQGDLLWLFPEVAHFYGPTLDAQWDEIYFVFEGGLFDLWRQHHIITPEKPVWHLEPVEFWAARLAEMTQPAEVPGWRGSFQQMTQWQTLVADMLLATGKNEPHQNSAWLVQACRQLEEEGPTPALSQIARNVGLSYETFRKKFSEKMGIAPAKYRQTRSIERACTLLMQRNLSHQQIAERLGFCDEFHFSKVFHRHMGFSPRAFRLKALGASKL